MGYGGRLGEYPRYGGDLDLDLYLGNTLRHAQADAYIKRETR